MHERINTVCAVCSDLTVHQMSDLHKVSPQIKISTPSGIFLFLKENVPVIGWVLTGSVPPTTIAFDFLNNLHLASVSSTQWLARAVDRKKQTKTFGDWHVIFTLGFNYEF